MVNRFIEIGFELSSNFNPGAGWVWDYKYHPSYLGDNHYTLIIFTSGRNNIITEKSEYRLYVHSNLDGKFISTLFQLNDHPLMGRDKLTEKFNELFTMELRDSRIDEILQ